MFEQVQVDIVEGVGISLSKFLHGASELVVSNHLIYSVYHNTLILRVHPPGILVSNGMNAHWRNNWIEFLNRSPKLFSCNGDIFLFLKDVGEVVKDKILSLV
jgi:hypothetical protein